MARWRLLFGRGPRHAIRELWPELWPEHWPELWPELWPETAPVRDELSFLMARAQAGDKRAYRRLLAACVPLAADEARRAGVRGAAVDGVVRNVLLTMHRAMPTYEPSRPFGPWLQAIAHRRALDTLRSHGQPSAREPP